MADHLKYHNMDAKVKQVMDDLSGTCKNYMELGHITGYNLNYNEGENSISLIMHAKVPAKSISSNVDTTTT